MLIRGLKKVQEEKRWDDVVNSLSLYNFTPQNIENIYKACLLKYEEKYFSGKAGIRHKLIRIESEDYVVKGSKIDRYFIPMISSKGIV